jgi:hypothetical protein|tara:strand:+ start:9551 stop:9826 length:276 start_codon:yes stop_codon:yes gene_type:complete
MIQDSLIKKNNSGASGYNKIYKHQWVTHVNALPMSAIDVMDKVCLKKYGWHFTPHEAMDYSREDWYKDQSLILTFESNIDLLVSKLTITLN